jgi:hypothetical protein
VTDCLLDWAACGMDAAWTALGWRMALSPHDAMLLVTALMAVEAFGVMAIAWTLITATERA